MTLRLHWSPDSANLIIRIALEMLGLPFEGVRLNRVRGDHKTAEYLAKNPQGLIPVLEDGDIILFETGAILWHVAERASRFGPDGPFVSDVRTRAEALSWTFFLANTVHSDLRIAFYPERYIADTVALRRGIAERMHAHCDVIESRLTGGLLGTVVTLPDIYLAVCLRWAQIYPSGSPLLPSLALWPSIQTLCARIEQMPACRRACASEHIPGPHPLTSPLPPDLPTSEVTGLS